MSKNESEKTWVSTGMNNKREGGKKKRGTRERKKSDIKLK